MPECMWKMDPTLDEEQWSAYEVKKPLLQSFEKRLRRVVPPAKVSWDPGALDVFFWAGGIGTSLTLDIWDKFTLVEVEKFLKQCIQVYSAVLKDGE